MKTLCRHLPTVWTAAAIAGLLLLAEPASGDGHGLGELRRMLQEGSSDLAGHTDETLERLGLTPADVVPLLAETLTDPRVRERERRTAVGAAVRLAEMGEGAPLVPALARAIHDEDFSVVSEALRALRYVGPEAAPAMPDLIEIMRDTPPWRTIQPIREIGEAAIPHLVEGLKSDALAVRTTCAEALVALDAEHEIRAPLTDPFPGPDAELQAKADRSPFFVARVDELLPSPGIEGLEVAFEALGTLYRLERDHPEFEVFRTRLEASLEDRRKVLFVHESYRLTRVLRGPRPDWLRIDTSPFYGCLLVADDPALEGKGCTVVDSSTLDLGVSNLLRGYSWVPVHFLDPLCKGELFFWSSRERQAFNAGFVDALTRWPGASCVVARFAHPSLEEGLTRALADPEISPKHRYWLSAALQDVRDELEAYGASADP